VSLRTAIAAGVGLGVLYSLSPLLVLSAVVLTLMLRWSSKGLPANERTWLLTLFGAAIAVKVLVIASLVLTADRAYPYSVFFGDEWIFKSRPIWLRNVALGVPISTADFIYAFDETGMSGHMYVLAFVQSLIGDAPYGVHMLSVTVYTSAVLLMHRAVRSSFGRLTAFGGAAVLLFLPSLFAWSISVLKEPIYIAVAIVELLMALAIIRAPRWWLKIGAAAMVVVLALAMEELRKATLVVAALGVTAGLSGWFLLRRRWTTVAAAVAVPVIVVVAFMQPALQARALGLVHQSIKYHAGHVVTPGVTYQLVDERIYSDWALIPGVTGRGAAEYVGRATIAYFVEPLPDHLQSRLLLAFLPEHIVWLVLVALVPFGIVPAFRRDRAMSMLLLAHAAGIIMMVALASGNIGTLIRHRGLSVPYLVWFSMLGAQTLLARALATRATPTPGEL
jgi:hypothetical protein